MSKVNEKDFRAQARRVFEDREALRQKQERNYRETGVDAAIRRVAVEREMLQALWDELFPGEKLVPTSGEG